MRTTCNRSFRPEALQGIVWVDAAAGSLYSRLVKAPRAPSAAATAYQVTRGSRRLRAGRRPDEFVRLPKHRPAHRVDAVRSASWHRSYGAGARQWRCRPTEMADPSDAYTLAPTRSPEAAAKKCPHGRAGQTAAEPIRSTVARTCRRRRPIPLNAPSPVALPGVVPGLRRPNRVTRVQYRKASVVTLMHPLILPASDHAEDFSIRPLFHEHAAERLHQRANPILGPIGEMVVQHQPLPKQRMRPPLHRVRLQPAVILSWK